MKNRLITCFKTFVKSAPALVLGLSTQMVLAHEGHGGSSLFQHDLEHTAWTFALLALGVVAIGVYKYRSK